MACWLPSTRACVERKILAQLEKHGEKLDGLAILLKEHLNTQAQTIAAVAALQQAVLQQSLPSQNLQAGLPGSLGQMSKEALPSAASRVVNPPVEDAHSFCKSAPARVQVGRLQDLQQ